MKWNEEGRREGKNEAKGECREVRHDSARRHGVGEMGDNQERAACVQLSVGVDLDAACLWCLCFLCVDVARMCSASSFPSSFVEIVPCPCKPSSQYRRAWSSFLVSIIRRSFVCSSRPSCPSSIREYKPTQKIVCLRHRPPPLRFKEQGTSQRSYQPILDPIGLERWIKQLLGFLVDCNDVEGGVFVAKDGYTDLCGGSSASCSRARICRDLASRTQGIVWSMVSWN
jgi:hypothetical protein